MSPFQQHSDLDMVTITEPERPENSNRAVKKRVVLVLGRQNPGDRQVGQGSKSDIQR